MRPGAAISLRGSDESGQRHARAWECRNALRRGRDRRAAAWRSGGIGRGADCRHRARRLRKNPVLRQGAPRERDAPTKPHPAPAAGISNFCALAAPSRGGGWEGAGGREATAQRAAYAAAPGEGGDRGGGGRDRRAARGLRGPGGAGGLRPRPCRSRPAGRQAALPVRPSAGGNGTPAAMESKICPRLAAKLGMAPGGIAGAGDAGGRTRKGRGGGGRRKWNKARAGGSSVRQVRIGGRILNVYTTSIPPDRVDFEGPGDPIAHMPGGGDQEATDLIIRGGALLDGGDRNGGRRCYKAILERFPDHYMANYSMGIERRLAGKPRSAVKFFARAIRVWPENHLAHAGMGHVLNDMEEYGRALESLDRALGILPGDPFALEGRDIAIKALRKRGHGG